MENNEPENLENADIETLDQGGEAEPEFLDDGSEYIDEGGQSPEVAPQKFGEEEYKRTHGNKNYYKDRQKELDASKDAAEQKKNETAANRKAANDAKKSAKQEKKAGEDGSKEQYKARKEEAKKAKSEDKAAKRDYRDAKRSVRQNKIDNFKSKAYQAQHPLDALKDKYNPMNKIRQKGQQIKDKAKDKAKQTTKKAARKVGNAAKNVGKKAGQAVAKAGKAAGKAVADVAAKGFAALASNPYFWIVVAALVLLLGIVLIVVVIFGSDDSSENISSGITAAQVNYDVNGVTANTVIEILNSDGQVISTVPFERYIAGVSLYKLGTGYKDEALKAEIIAVRTYLLNKGSSNGSSIQLKNNDSELIYWDYDKNLYRKELEDGTYIYTPEYENDPKEAPYKEKLEPDDVQKFETIVSDVMGMYAVDEAGSPIAVDISDSKAQELQTAATENEGTENGKYTALIMKAYPETSKIEAAEYQMIYYGEVGEFSTWKQKTKLGAPWGGVLLGTTATIDKVGCLVVSISMQIAYSGVPTGDITDFNPGTFATAMRNKGCFSSGGAINNYGCVGDIIPNFKYAGRIYLSGSKEERYQEIKRIAESGYFIVVEVRTHVGSMHWVSLDVQNSANAGWQDIYIWDPATTKTKISAWSAYKANQIVYFKKV